jgi:hypothetical protein
MPEIDPQIFVPFRPLHWTSIVHYLVILGALYILIASQSNVTIPFLMLVSSLAFCTVASLYAANIPGIPAIFVFIFRTLVVGLPFTIAGITKQEDLRGVGVILGVLGLFLFMSMLLVCSPPLGDPRLAGWCNRPPS